MLLKMSISLLFFSMSKLDYIIRAQKHILPIQSQNNVVYKFACRDCDASYIRQTCRQWKTRISEHFNHTKEYIHSIITEQRLKYSHKFDWENIGILDKERYLTKRLISEMFHIKNQKTNCNLQSDTEYLDNSVISILNKL